MSCTLQGNKPDSYMDIIPEGDDMVVNCGCNIAVQVPQENLSGIGVVKIANNYVPAIPNIGCITVNIVTVAFNSD